MTTGWLLRYAVASAAALQVLRECGPGEAFDQATRREAEAWAAAPDSIRAVVKNPAERTPA